MPAPALLVLVLSAAPAPAIPITFDDALRTAAGVPVVAGAREAAAVASQTAGEVSWMSGNPTVLLQPGYRTSPESGWEALVTLSQPFSFAGLGARRQEAAAAEARALAQAVRSISLEQRWTVSQAWVELWTAGQLVALRGREAELALEFRDKVSRAAEARLLTRADLAEAEGYLAEARLAHLADEGQAFVAARTLCRAVGGCSGVLETAGALPGPAVPDTSQVEQLAGALERSPRVASAVAVLEADTAKLAEWRARTSWQASVVLTAQRDVPAGFVFFGGLSLTPPLFDRGEREVGPLAQARARADAGVAQARLDARTELQLLVHEVEHTGETLHLVEGSLVPPAAERLRLRELQLQQGHATVLEVLLARRAALAAQARAVTARADHGLARVRLFFLAQELTP